MYKHKDITELIIQAFYTVYPSAGSGQATSSATASLRQAQGRPGEGLSERSFDSPSAMLRTGLRTGLVIELRKLGLEVIPEACIKVYYNPSTGSGQRGQVVGEYFADLLVAGVVIVEIKAVRTLAPEHEAQLLNYLKATPYEVGLLLNFGPEPQIKRKAYDNTRKGAMAWMLGGIGRRLTQTCPERSRRINTDQKNHVNLRASASHWCTNWPPTWAAWASSPSPSARCCATTP